MTQISLGVSVVVAAYLVGSVPFGFLVARWRGVDILSQGSGNVGATNVGRVLGRRFGILVFVLDFLKGAVPAFAAQVLALRHHDDLGPTLAPDGLAVLAGLAAFLGHVFPIYLRFRGGKGVATGAGVVAVLVPVPALAALVTWLAVVFVSRFVSLASLSAVVALCAIQIARPEPFSHGHETLTVFCLIAAGVVFARHRANVVRLARGNENRIKGIEAVSTLVKTAHVMALGLWFGSAVFFNLIVAPLIFQRFATLSADASAPERGWLPLPPDFNLDQSKQLAGVAVGPLFGPYFLVGGVCGLLTALTSLAWSRERSGRIHRVRAWLSLAALATVVAGWPLAEKVHAIGLLRYQGDDAARAAAREAFATWHLYSLALSLLTVALVTVLMALAARMPAEAKESVSEGEK